MVGRWALGKGSIQCLKGSPYNLAPGVMMLGLSQRYWTPEGLKSLAVLVVIRVFVEGHQAAEMKRNV